MVFDGEATNENACQATADEDGECENVQGGDYAMSRKNSHRMNCGELRVSSDLRSSYGGRDAPVTVRSASRKIKIQTSNGLRSGKWQFREVAE